MNRTIKRVARRVPRRNRLLRWWRALGPGLVTGAADDDPSGIVTYTQAGSQFGVGLLWTVVLTTPLMIAVQLASARLGWATRSGIGTSLRHHYPRAWVLSLVVLLAAANIFNLGADVAAMVEVARLATGGGHPVLWLLGITGLSLLLEILVPFDRYAPVLKLLTLALLSYAAVLFVVAVPWDQVWRGALGLAVDAAHGRTAGFNLDTGLMVCAIFGTTISPYLFFWQASHEAEDGLHGNGAAGSAAGWRGIRFDTIVGMVFSNGVALAVMIAAAATLFGNGGAMVNTAGEAAAALRPLAGEAAFLLFSMGLLGAGLLAIPVLAGSTAYALAEALGWRASLELPFWRAPKFYLLLCGTLGVAVLLQMVSADPMRMLFWAAVINGLVAVPILVALLLLVRRRDVMGDWRASRRLMALGWLTVAVMAVVAVTLVITAWG
jgi:Mn2+/Fe2+ NRAMP family transporter